MIVKAVEETAHRLGGIEFADAVETRVRAKESEHLTVVVADGPVVELLRPAAFGIHDTKFNHHGTLEHTDFGWRERLSAIYLIKYSVYLGVGIVLCVEFLYPMIAEAATLFGKEIVSDAKGIDDVSKFADIYATHFREFLDVCSECCRILYSHRFVGAPRGEHSNLKTTLACHPMPTQVIYWVVGGADDLHAITTHEPSGCITRLTELFVTFIKDFTGCCGVEYLVDTEGRLQFEVCPMIERVAKGIGDGLGPFLEFLPIRCVGTCAVAFGHSVGAHGAPFVMVSTQPKLGDTAELMVFGYHLRNQMAMVVDDGHLLGVVVIKVLSCLGREQEVFVHKGFHTAYRFLVFSDESNAFF